MLLTFYPILSHCALEDTTAYWMDFYNALWYQSLWYVTIQYGTMRCHVMWYDMKLYTLLSPRENLSWTLVLTHLTAHTMAERHHTVFVKRIFLIQLQCLYIAPNIIGTELQMMPSINSFWIVPLKHKTSKYKMCMIILGVCVSDLHLYAGALSRVWSCPIKKQTCQWLQGDESLIKNRRETPLFLWFRSHWLVPVLNKIHFLMWSCPQPVQ